MVSAKLLFLIFFLYIQSAFSCIKHDLDNILQLPNGQCITIKIVNGKIQAYLNRTSLSTYWADYTNYIEFIYDNNKININTVKEIKKYIIKNKNSTKEYKFKSHD